MCARVLLLILLWVWTSYGAERLTERKDEIESAVPAAVPTLPLRKTSAGDFQIGAVTFNVERREIWFPAQLNMTSGLIEYAVVGNEGKLHESLLRTEARPYHIHLAMLWLSPTNRAAVSVPASNAPPASIAIRVSWKKQGRARETALEDWIQKKTSRRPLGRGPWKYQGSRISEGVFVAERDQSIIAIIDDLDALVGNPRAENDNDDIWYAHPVAKLPEGTPVTVHLKVSL
jgi:hypothetical protein